MDQQRRRKYSAGGIVRKGVVCLLAVVFLVSAAKVISLMADRRAGEETYSEVQETVTPPPPVQEEPQPEEPEPEPVVYCDTHAEALAKTDLSALRETNEDVVGWISIPDTPVDYPLMQGEDNDYYLNHTWDRAANSVGSIYLEHQVSPAFDDFNTIIYGHRMKNNSMFGSLKYYKDAEYWQAHPSVYIVNDDGVHRYAVFAAYEAAINEITYGLEISEDSTKQRFIEHGLTSSVIDTGVVPTEKDLVLTLVTCIGRDYSSRWVVQAVLQDSAPLAENTKAIP